MAKLSVTAGGYQSLVFSVQEMSSTTQYPRKYEFVVDGTVKATQTDSTAGVTSVQKYVYGLQPSTTYTCHVYIYNSNTGYRVATLGPVSARTDAAPVTTIEVSIVNYLNGVTGVLYNGKVSGTAGSTFTITSAGTQYASYHTQYDFIGFRLSTDNYQTLYTDTSKSIAIYTGLTVQAYYKSKTVYRTVTGFCDTGVSNYKITASTGESVTVSSSSTGISSIKFEAGKTVTIHEVQVMRGYKIPYLLSQNSSSDQYGWYGPTQFTGSYKSLDVTYDRRIKVGATLTLYYPYTQRVYIDGAFIEQDTRSDNTNSQVTIASLSLYQRYIGYSSDYEFQYALVGASSTQYGANSTVTLTASTETTIYLYFQRKIKSVAPVVSSVSTTRRTATVSWSKNGGQYGSWILYYGASTSSMQSTTVTASPVTVSGLSPGQTYTFYVRNSVSSSDYKDSNSVSATTLSLIGTFAWTSSDGTLIAQGQPIKNLTASAWSTLINKVSACGGATAAIPTAAPSAKITESHFNQMRNAILNLTGAGSITDSVSSGSTVIKATMFANHDLSLKNAINRAIANRNLQ